MHLTSLYMLHYETMHLIFKDKLFSARADPGGVQGSRPPPPLEKIFLNFQYKLPRVSGWIPPFFKEYSAGLPPPFKIPGSAPDMGT
jgi:hypothetical protein